MSYSIDLSKISLEQYKKELRKKILIPSRQILREQVDAHFNAFKSLKIKNLEELFLTISNKKAKTELLKDDNISDEYLTILQRELKSIQSRPLKLSEFTWISKDTITKIEKAGIMNTKVLYERLGKSKERKQFSKIVGADEKVIVELLKLSDLTRIQWVNATFAHILMAAGFDTVEKVSQANHEDLYNKVSSKNNELKLYKGKIGLNDMKICIEAAKSIDKEIDV